MNPGTIDSPEQPLGTDNGQGEVQSHQPHPELPSTSKSKIQTSKAPSSDFTVIWHDLTYEVDSRPWYTKVKEGCFGKSRTNKSDRKTTLKDIEESSSESNNEPNNSKTRTILNKLCGDAKSRQMTGILGPSGAGKSTLLSCLFQNRTDGTQGQILVDREIEGKLKVCFIPQHDYLNEWLTVREDLVFVSRLKTAQVGEKGGVSDTSIGRLRGTDSNDGQKDHKSKILVDHEENAERVAETLGLTDCLDVLIEKISGGQKKRLSIARELMSKPDVLILDEPTTGLDSYSCYKTMVVLRELAVSSPHPMAVIVTIHQPSREVFNLFDTTYFLSKNGQVIYDDHPRKVMETLDLIAHIQIPVQNYNPASFLIDIAIDDTYEEAVDCLIVHQRVAFYKKYDPSFLKKLMKPKLDMVNKNWHWNFRDMRDGSLQPTLSAPTSLPEQPDIRTTNIDASDETLKKMSQNSQLLSATTLQESFNKSGYFISYQLRKCLSSHKSSLPESFRHMFILTKRSWLSVTRNPTQTRSRVIYHVVLPLILGFIYRDVHGKTNNCPSLEPELDVSIMARSIEDGLVAKNVEGTVTDFQNSTIFFFLIYGLGVNIISGTASIYPLTMNMFKKETINGLYSPGSYFIGQTLAELPLEMFLPTVSMILTYSLTGQASSYLEWRMFTAAFLMFLSCYSIHAMGLLFGAMFINNVNLSVIIGQAMLTPPALISGFVIRLNRMPLWLYILSYTSVFRLSLSGIMATRYGFNLCDCDEESLVTGTGFTMKPNVKHVLEYLFPRNASSPDDFDVVETFDSLGKSFVKAQTFALDIKSCDDVKPYPMVEFYLKESDLPIAIVGLFIMIFVFKCITYSVMKSLVHRIR